MGIVTGKFKMWISKFWIFFCLFVFGAADVFAKDLEILGVETIMHGNFDGGAPEVEIRVKLRSLSEAVIGAPRGTLFLEAADGRIHQETAQLISTVAPGFEIDTTLRFQVPHWWAAAEPTLRFELLDYTVHETLVRYRERLESGTLLGEAVVAASLGVSSPVCDRWREPGFQTEAKQYIISPGKKYLEQSDGFLRIALILGLRHCFPEEIAGMRETLEPGLYASLEEVLQILVSNLDAMADAASPLARMLPEKTRTLKDLFERPTKKRMTDSITVRYGSTTIGSHLDTSPTVALEERKQDWSQLGLIAVLGILVTIAFLNWSRRREQ